jgi:hypothetical protein
MPPRKVEKYKFIVNRDIKVGDHKYTPSTITVYQSTYDPFLTADMILEHYRNQGFRGFVEHISFESATDAEFEASFGPDPIFDEHEGQGRR